MLSKILSAIVGIVGALAGTGPAVLYNRLNGLTFNPPGYTIVMYQSCMQNQNAGNPCGSFSTFESSNGVYTTQLYGPEAPVSSTCSRTFRLALACGATMSMSGVNENPTCVYSATLTLPEACGVDMTVGNEAASASGTVAPPTPSMTRTSTASSTGTPSYTYTSTGTLSSSVSITSSWASTASVSSVATATSTPLFEITAYPSRTVTPSVAATTSPIFMVTAYPTTSPVNASGPSLLDTLGVTPGSSTATILGAVAVGVLGIAFIVGTIIYFRNGGTVKGLAKKFEENKETIKKVTGSVADLLPLSEEQKKKIDAAIDNPSSLVPQEVIQVAEKAEQYKAQVIAALPVSADQKAKLTASVDALQKDIIKQVELSPIGSQIKSVVSLVVPSPAPVAAAPSTVVVAAAPQSPPPAPEPPAPEPPAPEPPAPEPPAPEPALVAVQINAEDLESVRAFLQSKKGGV